MTFHHDRSTFEPDLESGILALPKPVHSSFSLQVAQIQSNTANARNVIIKNDEDSAERSKQLEFAENEVRTAFEQLAALATNNHKFSYAPASRRDIGTMRIVHITKCTDNMLDVIELLDVEWMKHHGVLAQQINKLNIENGPGKLNVDDNDQNDDKMEHNQVTKKLLQLRSLSQRIQTFVEIQHTIANTEHGPEFVFSDDDYVTASRLELERSLTKSSKKIIILVMVPLCVLVLIVGVVASILATQKRKR